MGRKKSSGLQPHSPVKAGKCWAGILPDSVGYLHVPGTPEVHAVLQRHLQPFSHSFFILFSVFSCIQSHTLLSAIYSPFPISHPFPPVLQQHTEPKVPLCLQEYDPWKSSDRICRQLIYHLTPHSKWHRHGMPRRKSQMW